MDEMEKIGRISIILGNEVPKWSRFYVPRKRVLEIEAVD